MKKGIILVLSICLLVTFSLHAREVTISIGEWKNSSGRIGFSVRDSDGVKRAIIYVTDKYVIETNLFVVDTWQLIELKILIDETIEEIEKNPNKAIDKN